ncbi:hypothetical protein F-M6_0256 [Faustovirus]|nr:hypothetical protein F-M6_0256 [Faustovirus]
MSSNAVFTFANVARNEIVNSRYIEITVMQTNGTCIIKGKVSTYVGYTGSVFRDALAQFGFDVNAPETSIIKAITENGVTSFYELKIVPGSMFSDNYVRDNNGYQGTCDTNFDIEVVQHVPELQWLMLFNTLHRGFDIDLVQVNHLVKNNMMPMLPSARRCWREALKHKLIVQSN